MRESFERAQEHLDIETPEDKQAEKQIEQAHEELQKISPEKLGTVLEALQKLNAGKMFQISA